MRWNSIQLCYSRTNDKYSTRMNDKNYLRVVENLTADLRYICLTRISLFADKGT